MSLRRRRRAAAALLGCGLVVGGVVVWSGARGSDTVGHVVADSAGRAVKTIEYDGIRVDVPAQWRRVDSDRCQLGFEQWAPATTDPCDVGRGVGFYRSATFDTALQPRQFRRFRSGGTRVWAGYVLVDELAVSASDPDRTVAQRVVASVRRVPR